MNLRRIILATGILIITFCTNCSPLFASRDLFFVPRIGLVRAGDSLGNMYDNPLRFNVELGFLYALSRHWSIGAGGGTTTLTAHLRPDGNTPDISLYFMDVVARYRLFKHDWTPYAEVRTGIAFIDNTSGFHGTVFDIGALDDSDTRPSLGGVIGVQVPVSEKLDIDLSVRSWWMPGDHGSDITLTGINLGIVYVMR